MNHFLDNPMFLVFAWLTITSVVATVAGVWQKVRRAQLNTTLKEEMLERGLSVEEMERVLRPAGQPLPEESAYRAFGECLAAQSLSGTSLEEIMVSFREADLPAKWALVQTLRGLANGGGQRSLSMEEMKRLLKPGDAPLSEEAAYRGLGQYLYAAGALSGGSLEEIMTTFRAADLPAKRAIVETLKGIMDSGNEPDEAGMLGLVRGFRAFPAFPDSPPAGKGSEQFAVR
jgi:hypothetical protein